MPTEHPAVTWLSAGNPGTSQKPFKAHFHVSKVVLQKEDETTLHPSRLTPCIGIRSGEAGAARAGAQPGSTRAGHHWWGEHQGDGGRSPWDTWCGCRGTGLPGKAGAGAPKIPPPAGLGCCQGPACCQALSAVAESCLREGWNCTTCLSYQWNLSQTPAYPDGP